MLIAAYLYVVGVAMFMLIERMSMLLLKYEFGIERRDSWWSTIARGIAWPIVMPTLGAVAAVAFGVGLRERYSR